MNGMTGYSYKEFYLDSTYISTEIKTVNHRFLDVNIHLPPFLSPLEMHIRELVSASFIRGKIDVNVYIRLKGMTSKIEPNLSLAKQYYESLCAITAECGIEDKVTLDHLVRYEDILSYDTLRDSSEFWDAVRGGLDENVREVNLMRQKEGAATRQNVVDLIGQIAAETARIASLVPDMERALFELMQVKMTELVGSHVDQDRVLSEVGIMVSRSCVNEELERLKHHVTQFEKIINDSIDVGKRLDFICQEMHREINTLGSKVTLPGITNYVISIKNSIEKIREQIRNIE